MQSIQSHPVRQHTGKHCLLSASGNRADPKTSTGVTQFRGDEFRMTSAALILMSFQLVRRSETMKGIFLSAAMMVMTISGSANAGLFGLFEHDGCGHGCGNDCCEPTCCAPADACCEPTCCAPAEACCEPTCCAPAEACCEPACCAPAACCEPTNCCGEGCCRPKKKCGLFSHFKMPKLRLPKLFSKRHGCGHGCSSEPTCCAPANACCEEPSCCAPANACCEEPTCCAPVAPSCCAPCN